MDRTLSTFAVLFIGAFFSIGMTAGPRRGAAPEAVRADRLDSPLRVEAPRLPALTSLPEAVASGDDVAAPPLRLFSQLSHVHCAAGKSRAALLLEFSAPVNHSVELLDDGRVGIRLSPVDGTSLRNSLSDFDCALFAVEVESEGRYEHRILLTPAERLRFVAPTASESSGQGRSLVFSFVEEPREATAPTLPGRTPLGELRLISKSDYGRGLLHHQYRWVARSGKSSTVNVLELPAGAGPLRLEVAVARNRVQGLQTLSALASEQQALAALNGSFFAIGGKGNPLGLLVKDGRLLSAPIYSRTSVGVFPGGRVLFGNPTFSGRLRTPFGDLPLDGLNQPPMTGKIVLYSPEYGETTATRKRGLEFTVRGGRVVDRGSHGSPIPRDGFVFAWLGPRPPRALLQLRPGSPVRFEYGLTPPWNLSRFALGGGPRLLREGEVAVNAREERFKPSFRRTRAPRSALGITSDHRLFLVAVDGRRPPKDAGVNLDELAHLMKSLGCRDAMNLDGGGSTTMWLAGEVINTPSGKTERKISSALVLKAR